MQITLLSPYCGCASVVYDGVLIADMGKEYLSVFLDRNRGLDRQLDKVWTLIENENFKKYTGCNVDRFLACYGGVIFVVEKGMTAKDVKNICERRGQICAM